MSNLKRSGVLSGPERLAVDPFLVATARRDSVTVAEHAGLALVYVLSVAAGERNPARALATRYPGSSEKTWTNRFNRLRSLGLLTPAPRRGVAGGELTPRAIELLGSDLRLDPRLLATYKAGAKPVLTAAQAVELAGLPDWETLRWLADNPTAGVEDPEDWWNRVAESAGDRGSS